MTLNSWREHAPGLLLAALLGTGAWLLSGLPWLAEWRISALTLAIVLGMLLGNLAGRHLPVALNPGMVLAQKRLLRLGIILFGLRISFQDIAAVGLPGLVLDVIIVTGTLLLGSWAGRRLFGMDRHTALLTASGSAICGAAAVLAVERVIRPEPGKVAIAVATVVLFGTLDIFLYPALYPLLGLGPDAFGLFTGATVHEVAQVVAVGSAIGPETANTAVIVKLTRVMLLVPVLLLLSHREARAGGAGARMAIPWFALAFVGVSALNSLVTIPPAYKSLLLTLDTLLLATAMAALGVATQFARLRALGTRPLLLALLLFVWLVLAGLLLTHLLI